MFFIYVQRYNFIAKQSWVWLAFLPRIAQTNTDILF